MKTFFKETPFYYLSNKEIIKEFKGLLLGKMNSNNYYCVEDEFFITQYKTLKPALKHFNIDKKIIKSAIKQLNNN